MRRRRRRQAGRRRPAGATRPRHRCAHGTPPATSRTGAGSISSGRPSRVEQAACTRSPGTAGGLGLPRAGGQVEPRVAQRRDGALLELGQHDARARPRRRCAECVQMRLSSAVRTAGRPSASPGVGPRAAAPASPSSGSARRRNAPPATGSPSSSSRTSAPSGAANSCGRVVLHLGADAARRSGGAGTGWRTRTTARRGAAAPAGRRGATVQRTVRASRSGDGHRRAPPWVAARPQSPRTAGGCPRRAPGTCRSR